MPFTPWQRPDDLALAPRACARHIAALNQLRTQTKNQLHATQQTTTTPDFLIASRHQSIAHFNAQRRSTGKRGRVSAERPCAAPGVGVGPSVWSECGA